MVITDRGKPAFVLMTSEEFQQHEAGDEEFLADLIMCDDGIELDLPERSDTTRATPVELTFGSAGPPSIFPHASAPN